MRFSSVVVVGLTALSLTACGGATRPPSFDASAVRAAFARAGITSYMLQSSGARSGNGFKEGYANLVLHLHPGCRLPTGYYSLPSSLLDRTALVFTRCRMDWVITFVFRSATEATEAAHANHPALSTRGLSSQVRGNVFAVYRPSAEAEADSALHELR